MTLITYPTRVHFADAVMEEALLSELERAGAARVLLICETSLTDSEFSDRVGAGLPRSVKPLFCALTRDAVLSDMAKSMGADPELSRADAVIAFGSARAIEMGRKVRRALFLKRGDRPPLYAIPGVDGLPDPCTRNLESWRDGLPSVLICDPTLTLSATPGQTMRSAVVSMMRCIESYLSAAYNPPADGMALDGFNRCVNTLPDLGKAGDLDLGREVMAASLDATMAQEKGLGPTQVLSAALAAECDTVDPADAARLILPGIVGAMLCDDRKAAVLARMLGPEQDELDAALRRFLSGVPLLPRLSATGLTPDQMHRALAAIAGRTDISAPAVTKILQSAY